MRLSDRDMFPLLKKGLLVENQERIKVGPDSIDLTLGDSFKIISPYQEIITLGEEVYYQEVGSSQFILKPGQFCLATTNEVVNIPKYLSAMVQGRSSIGRSGLQIQNAGHIDSGFKGQITLELHNQSHLPMVIQPGREIRICQIIFYKLNSECINPYNGKYQNQTGATESRLQEDFC